MSSGQKRRIPANFPRMKYRHRARWRHFERWTNELNAIMAGIDMWALVAPDPIPKSGLSLTYRRWLPGDDPAEPVQITEKGRAVVESGLSVRHVHELETGCHPTALCDECREIG